MQVIVQIVVLFEPHLLMMQWVKPIFFSLDRLNYSVRESNKWFDILTINFSLLATLCRVLNQLFSNEYRNVILGKKEDKLTK